MRTMAIINDKPSNTIKRQAGRNTVNNES